MGDNCNACCQLYEQHLETERAARLDLDRRFEAFCREQFVRRQTLVNAQHLIQDKTRELIKAEQTIELLSMNLAEWQRLAENSPLMTLKDAIGELSGITDPHDVDRVEDLPAAPAGAAA